MAGTNVEGSFPFLVVSLCAMRFSN